MQCVVWSRAGNEREGAKTLPEQDLRALYQAQHCESHKISKQQKAKRQSSKSAAICTIPNCVCIFDKYTPPKRDYMTKPAKWEEFGLTGTSWLISERT